MSENQSVLIAGAGPTGLVLAHELARGGIRCRVIDKTAHRAMQSRAIAIHARTLETFELMKVVDDFLAAGHRIGGVRICGDHGPIADAGFGALETRYPYVLGVPQDETERILEENTARHGIRVERNTELVALTQQDGGVSARLCCDGRVEEVTADWLIGCDGAHSTVRDQAAIPFSGNTYPEHFVLADLRVEGDLDRAEAQVWLAEHGAVAFFPLPGDRYRLIIANSPADWQDGPSLVQCQALVEERGRHGLRLTDLRWSAVFRIHRREAARFRQGRVFLLGDAAHIHSPVGGQGMNIGIQDSFNLAWKLRLVVPGEASPGLLDSYEAERKPVDEAVIRQTDRATRLVSLHGSLTRFVRDHLMSLLTRLPSFDERFGERISGIGFDYRHSPVVEEHPMGGNGPRAGDRAPDAPVDEAETGGSLRLYDLFAEQRHVLLVVGNGGDGLQAALPHYPEAYFAGRRIAAPGTADADLIDRQGEVAARYGSVPAAYLVRPDGYVGFRCPIANAGALLPKYMTRFLGSARQPLGFNPGE